MDHAIEKLADTEPSAPTITPHQDLLRRITLMFKARMEEQRIRPGTAKYQNAAIEFFCGALTALRESDATVQLNEALLILVAVGRDPVKEWL